MNIYSNAILGTPSHPPHTHTHIYTHNHFDHEQLKYLVSIDRTPRSYDESHLRNTLILLLNNMLCLSVSLSCVSIIVTFTLDKALYWFASR